MAWPNDARHYNFALKSPLPAATLNAIQDAIVALYQGPRVAAVPMIGSEGFDWSYDTANGYYELVADDKQAFYALELPGDATISQLRLEYYVAAAKNLRIKIVEIDAKLGTPADAPAVSVLDNSHDSASDSETPPYWKVWTYEGSITAIGDRLLGLVVYDADIGDRLSMAEVTFAPWVTP